MKTQPAFRSRLNQAIWASGLKKKAIAERIGIDNSRLSRIISGDVDPTDHEAVALSTCLQSSRKALGV